MTSREIREKYIKFFEKNDHRIIPSASLVPSDEEQLAGKEKVLFTSAGMQPLIPYLMGKPHPQGKKLVNVQKCLRMDDIEQVGDAVHHTFFEMLGNWSLGAYWKSEAIELSFKFLTEELEIPIEKLAISVFAGDDDAPHDEESANKWKSLGVSEKRIAYLGKEANWWPTPRKDLVTGELKNAFGPCGPDTEMFIWTGEDPAPDDFDPRDSKWVEVWNDVFMEFNRKEDGTLEELPQKNVDTGMGLERMLAVIKGKDNDYETDLFEGPYELVRKLAINFNSRSVRIIVDHIKAAVFLIGADIEPDRAGRGSVLRSLIRRSLEESRKLGINVNFMDAVAIEIQRIYKNVYPEVENEKLLETLDFEENRYKNVLSSGVPLAESIIDKYLEKFDYQGDWLPLGKEAAKIAFDLHQSQGLPEDYFIELFIGKLQYKFTDFLYDADQIEEIKKEFEKLNREHKEKSRGVVAGQFKGGLADHSETVIKYHTTTHLLHQALRDVLGPQVFQKGSNITSERLRFDFSFDRKMTEEEVKAVENIINDSIKQNLKVDYMTIPLDEAKKMNAMGLFNEKYADKVSIYGVGPGYGIDSQAKDQRDRGGYYSLEVCIGPHVEKTGEIGHVTITKKEGVGTGIRRVYAELR